MPFPSDAARLCPCGSGLVYRACCGPLHDGAAAATAEQLMRSRYSAYALDHRDHLFRTWHPRTRPDDLSPSPGVTWLGLEIIATEGGGDNDETGTVTFVAHSQDFGVPHELHETSRFVRRGGRWVYLDGDVAPGVRLRGRPSHGPRSPGRIDE